MANNSNFNDKNINIKDLLNALNEEAGNRNRPRPKRAFEDNGNESSLKKALDRERDITIKAYNKELEEKKKAYKKHLSDIAKANLSAQEREKRIAKETEAYKTAVLKIEEQKRLAEEKRISKEKIILRNAEHEAYIKADLEEKRAKIRNRREELEVEVEEYELRRRHNLLSEEELAILDAKMARADRLFDRELSMIELQRESNYEQLNAQEKIKAMTDDYYKRQEAAARLAKETAKETAALESDFKSGKISEKDYNLKKEAINKNKKKQDKEDDAKFGSLNPKNWIKKGLASVFGIGKDEDKNGGKSTASKLGGIASALADFTPIGRGVKAAVGIAEGIKEGTGFSADKVEKIMELIKGIAKVLNKVFNAINQGISSYATLQDNYYAKVTARLDGTDKTFATLSKYFTDSLGSSPYVSQQHLIETMASLTEKGIAYNLEQRTILSELADRMVSTFDMLDETLVRLTKLQQTDMSVAAISSESKLTRFLNSNFEDTSYLSAMYDSVNSTLLEATSQMNYEQATSFTYAVQKWLGSMYSLGMSTSGVNTLAEGINALASGNFDAFNSNESLRNLFALAAGGSYADLLVNGVNTTNVDQLLSNITEYLGQISEDTNQVTKKVKAGLFGGLSVSDIRAISNLVNDTSAMTNLRNTGNNVTWDSARSDFMDYLIPQAQNNTTWAKRIDNIISNTLLDVGESFVNGAAEGSSSGIGNSIGGIIGKLGLNFGDANAYTAWAVGGKIGGTVGTIIQAVSLLSQTGDILKTVGNAFSTATVDLDKLDAIAALVDESLLISNRGSHYAGISGIEAGLSLSSSIKKSAAASTASTVASVAATGGSTSSKITSLSEQANTTTESSASYTDATSSTLARDVSDIYTALFEDRLAIRVILADIEANAVSAISASNADSTAHLSDISDDISSIKGYTSHISDLKTELSKIK